jgi:hypothetical protein
MTGTWAPAHFEQGKVNALEARHAAHSLTRPIYGARGWTEMTACEHTLRSKALLEQIEAARAAPRRQACAGVAALPALVAPVAPLADGAAGAGSWADDAI